MRTYKDKNNAQKKQYYDNRFYVSPMIEREDTNGTIFEEEVKFLRRNDIEILDGYVELEQLVVIVNSEQNLKTLELLKNFGYEQLSEVAAIDFLAVSGGYEVFYQLLSVSQNKRARVKCFVKQGKMLKSVSEIYKSANWAEREMYDMSGVFISGHPNLKRLIMPDDWHSHPLLKSYPLQGDEFAAWYEVDKIFGRERRDEIGAENRDPAFIDEKDTFNFSRIFHETANGDSPNENKILQEYQEDGGVKFVKKIKRNQSEILKERP
ncbi:MAG: NADH-quinone oxidoreductase subunit C [Campylobacter sp.]|nr:NADH-quinone oxidoreductase subunit C [Campylobacter sp.]